MITSWVLIVYFNSFLSGGGATTAEFNSKQDCLQAVKVLKAKGAGWDFEMTAVCVPKGVG